MRKSLLLAVASLLLVVASPARAQFCPGVSPWVFDDVAASDPFCGYITWMAENGISLGCQIVDPNHRLYCPNDNVTRKQMAAFMNRLGDARVESVDTGPGLTGGPITSVGTINLATTQLLPTTPCTSGQMPVWNGTAWACGTASGGTVTSVATGPGMLGGPITSSGTITIDSSYWQRRVTSACAGGTALSTVQSDGSPTCVPVGTGSVTSVATGTGLTGGPITGAGTVAIANGGVGTPQLADGAVTEGKRVPLTNATASGQVTSPITQTLAFIGPTVTLAVPNSRPLLVIASAALGSTSPGGAIALNIAPCWQVLPSGAPIVIGQGLFGLTAAQNQRHTFSVNGISAGLAAGSYKFGLCGQSVSANWNSNDYASVSAVVL